MVWRGEGHWGAGMGRAAGGEKASPWTSPQLPHGSVTSVSQQAWNHGAILDPQARSDIGAVCPRKTAPGRLSL